MTGRAFDWTDERVETLRKLWAAGTSASLIARELVGTTRCGVLGKLHRLGLSGPRTKSKMRLPASGNKTPRKPEQKVGAITGKPVVRRPPTTIRATIDTRTPKPDSREGRPRSESKAPTPIATHDCPADAITIHELSDDRCHFPLGDPRATAFRYCGASVPRAVRDRGLCYCFTHLRIAYQAGTATGPTTARRMREVIS